MHIRLLVAAFLAASTPAFAQIESREGIELQNQILELRQDMQQLQQLQTQAGGEPTPIAPPLQQPQGGQAPDNDVSAQLVVRVSELEEQMRSLQGKVEELSNQLQRQNDDLTKQIGDLAFKAGQGQAAGLSPGPQQKDGATPSLGASGPASVPSMLPKPGLAPVPHKTPEMLMKEGNAALARRDYAAAEAASRQVLTAGGPRQTEAQFLLARAQFGGHQYQASAASYYAAYSHAPKSPRAAEALLGVTDALLGLNDKTDACQALGKLSSEFPHPDPALHARAASLRQRAACH